MVTVAVAFAEQLRPWQIWASVPGDGVTKLAQERLLEPDELQFLPDGRVLIKEPEDYTHIIHAPTLKAAERVPAAACEYKASAKTLINPRANVEPTCKVCAQIWKAFYQEKKV